MLSVQVNEELTQVGPGTPMGELMRRYWHPVAASGELDDNPTKAVRILCENLVLYKDRSGTLGLIDESCPHRRVNLLYGIPEEKGLRCPYHGWLMDETGQCIEMPAEAPDSTFKDRVKVKAYPVQELGGLIFAYLGPEPAPLLPHWDVLTWNNVYKDIGINMIPCNWLQCQENSLDSTHTEWLHGYYGSYMRERRDIAGGTAVGVDSAYYQQQVQEGTLLVPETPSRAARGAHHSKLGYDIFAYGIYKRRIYEGGSEEDASWLRGHPIVFPNILRQTGGAMQFRVPIDDSNTLHFMYETSIPPAGVQAPEQETIPYYHVPVVDQKTGGLITDYFFGQDYMTWISQGLRTDGIAERNSERLAESDKGIILFRRLLKEQMKVVADGGDPITVFRKPHDVLHLTTEIAPGDTYRDPAMNERQASVVGRPGHEVEGGALYGFGQRRGTGGGTGGGRPARDVSTRHQRYSSQVAQGLKAMEQQAPSRQG